MAINQNTTKTMAERHEALWLRLQALHKDTIALGAKKPDAPVGESLRITVESLLSDCAPFARKPGERLPVAAGCLQGLAVQLGQALARLEEWEAHHTSWDERFKCRIWQVNTGYLPIMRLNPPKAALHFEHDDPDGIRNKLAFMMKRRNQVAYEDGFKAGRAARVGPPEAETAPGYAPNPRILRFD